MDIETLRSKIDELDDQIAKLYDERMGVVKKIGEEKSKGERAVVDGAREKKIISRVTKKVEENIRVYTKQVFNTIFDTSKAYQMQITDAHSASVDKIKSALENRDEKFPTYGRVACQGIEGAYSNLATEKLFELSDITYFKTFDAVFQAVEAGFCEFGLLPLENSSVGSVGSVYDLMKEHKFYIARSIKLRISHNVLAKKGAKLENIKEIVSHEQAINQCSRFLRELKDVKITVVANTALASRMVAESDRLDLAAISSISCAEGYNLSALARNIQDNDGNYTRFILISKEMKIYPHANKISFMTTLAHEAGSLNKLLSKFATMGVSLTKLESRPIAGSNFEFMFYFDFLGDIDERNIQNLLAELENGEMVFSFLGSYLEVEGV